jgi:hypothetical protein
MRGRIRQLKPEIYLDDEFEELEMRHPELRLFKAFSGLWCQADREGRFEWKPAMLKTQILPYWSGDFASVLRVLNDARYIARYEVDGRAYGWIRNFSRHQRPNNREPASIIPPPLEHAEAGDLKSAEADCSSLHEPPLLPAEAPRASRLPTPDPIPDSRPRAAPSASRVLTMPGPEPDQEYLDLAVMGAVSKAQALSTWKHYWGAGLPPGGVEKLRPWLVQRAVERSVSTARAPGKPPPGAPPERLNWRADVRARAYAEDRGGDFEALLTKFNLTVGIDDCKTTTEADRKLMRFLRQELGSKPGETA